MKSQSSPRKLSFLSIYFLGINGIVGSGAFLLPQEVYRDVNLFSVVALVTAGVTVSLVALCYADLSSRFSKSGAAWLYGYHAFGNFVGYELGIFTWFLGSTVLAAEVVAFFTTLRNLFPIFNNHSIFIWSGIGLVAVFGIINLFGRDIIRWVDNISSAAKLATIIIFIIIGVFFISKANFTPVLPRVAEVNGGVFVSRFGAAFNTVFYLFTGFSFIPIAAAQMRNPEKNIPRVLISVMISITILYTLMFLVAIGILGTDIVNHSIPIADAMKVAVGTWGYGLIVIGMIISIFGVAFALSFNTPSLLASLANQHQMISPVFGKKNGHDAPWVAIIATTGLSMFLTTQPYLFLVSCIVFSSFVQYVPTILALMKFKHTKEFPNHGFQLKGGYLIPILSLGVCAYMAMNFKLPTILLEVGVGVIAGIIYPWLHKLSRKNTIMHH